MVRYLLPSVAIVATCVAVYATSLRTPPAEDQSNVVPVVPASPPPPSPAPARPERLVVSTSPPTPAPAQPEPVKPAPFRAQNPPPLSRPANAQAPLGHRRLNRRYIAPSRNPEPPSIHELLLSAQAARAGNNAPLVRRLREFETALSNRLVAKCRGLRCNRHRYLALRNRGNQVGSFPGVPLSYWPYWPAYWSYRPYWPRPSHDGFRSAGEVRVKHPGIKHRKDDDDDDDDD